jgi:SsrA-binding protein
MQAPINIKNKKAWFNYEFLEKFVAGIRLSGTEIKSIRQGKVSLVESYCSFFNHELFVHNMSIAEYSHRGYSNHIPDQDRKLLMNRKELKRLEKKVNEKGLTIIVLRIFINDRGLAKLEIALARGKREYDKREDLKKKDARRDMERLRKY